MKNVYGKIVAYLREFGKLAPIAMVTTFLPIVGSWTVIFLSIPLGSWLRANWEIGAVLFFLGTVTFCGLALLPTNVIGIIAGWAFGFGLGIVVLIAGIVAAATLSFFIHRRIVGDALPNAFENHPKAKAVYRALIEQNSRRTFLIVFLLRLSPAMPFALTNFLMASARVPLKAYVAGTFGGMLPRSSAVVFVGSGLSELNFNDPQEAWLIVFGIIATIVSIIFISVVARRALERLTAEKTIPATESEI